MTQELELKDFEVQDLKLNIKLKEQEKEQIKNNYEKWVEWISQPLSE